MATGRILKRTVESLPKPPEGKRAYLWDDLLKGFGVMVTPAGSRSYLIQYRIGGREAKTSRYTIGKHGSPWTAERARERAVELMELVRKKVDPNDLDRSRLAEAAEKKNTDERLGFGTYADFFIKKHAEAKKLRSAPDIKAVFRRDLKPHFGTKAVTAIKRTDVQTCMDALVERSGSAANKAYSWLNKMFEFAVGRGDIAASPMLGMEPPAPKNKRDRVLRGEELVRVWEAAGDMGQPWSALVRLLLLTGQRLREVAGMRWEEVDLDVGVWIIPGARSEASARFAGTKNKRDHLVPLSPQAIAVLKGLQPEPKLRKGVVLTTDGKVPVAGFSKPKKRLEDFIQDRVEKASASSGNLPMPLEHWTFHDLRRSLATGCQALGFPIEHTEAVLNHVAGKRGGLAAIYQLHEYRDEKTAALNAWARYVDALLAGSENNVIPMVAARA